MQKKTPENELSEIEEKLKELEQLKESDQRRDQEIEKVLQTNKEQELIYSMKIFQANKNSREVYETNHKHKRDILSGVTKQTNHSHQIIAGQSKILKDIYVGNSLEIILSMQTT